MEKYCVIIKRSCLKEGCSMYHHKEAQCALITALDLFTDFQNLMLRQSDSCMEIIDLLAVLDARNAQVQMNS